MKNPILDPSRCWWLMIVVVMMGMVCPGVASAQIGPDAYQVALTVQPAADDTPSVVMPGETVELQVQIDATTALLSVDNISFQIELDAVLQGLASISGDTNDICGDGSSVSGTNILNMTGGSLTGPDDSCSFNVMLQLPNDVGVESNEFTLVTSNMSGTVGGVERTTDAGEVTIPISFFVADTELPAEVEAGSTVPLTITIAVAEGYAKSIEDAEMDILLDDSLEGMQAVGTPTDAICGADSSASGTETLTVDGLSYAAPTGGCSGANCTICSAEIDVSIPADATIGEQTLLPAELVAQGFIVGVAPEEPFKVVEQGTIPDAGDGTDSGDTSPDAGDGTDSGDTGDDGSTEDGVDSGDGSSTDGTGEDTVGQNPNGACSADPGDEDGRCTWENPHPYYQIAGGAANKCSSGRTGMSTPLLFGIALLGLVAIRRRY